MHTLSVVLEAPERLTLGRLALNEPGPADVVVETLFTGISTGTERLLWSGRMPPFPGMGYPLVPGYEAVGRVVEAGPDAKNQIDELVFVPGAKCYRDARSLFGAASGHLIAPSDRVATLGPLPAEQGVLVALAATAVHAVSVAVRPPELIIGHGVLGRLLARVVIACGAPAPIVWEVDPARFGGAAGYAVVAPEEDPRRDYGVILDASGDAGILDAAMGRLSAGGEIVLAGFYERPLSFAFPPAFMREARIAVAAEWKPKDLVETQRLIQSGRLSLDGLITHRFGAGDTENAYRTAFQDATCLKMVLDWRGVA